LGPARARPARSDRVAAERAAGRRSGRADAAPRRGLEDVLHERAGVMRSSAVVLAVHSVRRMRAVLIGVAIVLGGFQFLLTQVAVFLLRRGGFGLISSFIPDFMQNMAGPSMLAFMSFQGVVAFGYFHPMVIATHVGLAIAVATEPAAEVETRFADLTLARS